MKKFSKSGLLLAAVMALCAFAPSMASASSWGPVPSHHTLDSPDLGFINDVGVGGQPVSSMCRDSQFTARVVSTAVMEIDTATFDNCKLSGLAGVVGACTATSTATNLPWTATARTTSDIQIHGVNIDVLVENTPGQNTCTAAGATIKITGTLTNGHWTGNNAVGQREVIFTTGNQPRAAHGLVSHSAFGDAVPITVTGTIRDTQNSLTVTN